MVQYHTSLVQVAVQQQQQRTRDELLEHILQLQPECNELVGGGCQHILGRARLHTITWSAHSSAAPTLCAPSSHAIMPQKLLCDAKQMRYSWDALKVLQVLEQGGAVFQNS